MHTKTFVARQCTHPSIPDPTTLEQPFLERVPSPRTELRPNRFRNLRPSHQAHRVRRRLDSGHVMLHVSAPISISLSSNRVNDMLAPHCQCRPGSRRTPSNSPTVHVISKSRPSPRLETPRRRRRPRKFEITTASSCCLNSRTDAFYIENTKDNARRDGDGDDVDMSACTVHGID